jgi:hypothetical protein
MSTARDERLLDLLAARATEGVDADAQRELSSLLQGQSEVDADGFDLAAAALYLAIAGATEEAPPELRARLERQGRAWLETRDAS